MPLSDDAFALQVLGRIQELRHELERLKDRSHARAFKAQLVELHDTCRGDRVPFTVGKIVDEFFALAKASILKSYGTSAWDEPESIEEAKARMGTLPAAPAPGVLDRVNAQTPAPITDEELHTIALEVEGWDIWGMSMVTAAHASWVGCRLVAEVRRLRSEEWLERAARDIAWEAKKSPGADKADYLAILQKHRDGKA